MCSAGQRVKVQWLGSNCKEADEVGRTLEPLWKVLEEETHNLLQSRGCSSVGWRGRRESWLIVWLACFSRGKLCMEQLISHLALCAPQCSAWGSHSVNAL